jgi:hypothetical protein
MAEQVRRPFGVGGAPTVPEGEEPAAAAEALRHGRAGLRQDIGVHRARLAARSDLLSLIFSSAEVARAARRPELSRSSDSMKG